MSDEAIDVETIDDEQPSSIKEGFQRWLIVTGLLVTMLFAYMYLTMSAAEEEKKLAEEADEVTVPTQVQGAGSPTNQNLAITKFQKDITEQKNSPVGEKVQSSSLNPAFAPRKTQSYAESEKQVKEAANKKRQASFNKFGKPEKSPYQTYLEKEQMRAYQSVTSSDTIGKGTFYQKDKASSSNAANQNKSANAPTKESIAERQSQLKKKIDAISQYRKAIESGEIDPTTPPPKILGLGGGNQ